MRKVISVIIKEGNDIGRCMSMELSEDDSKIECLNKLETFCLNELMKHIYGDEDKK